jgi:hypothetical protein
LEFPLAQQRPYPPNRPICSQIVFANVRQDLAHLIEPRLLGFQQNLGSLGIAKNSSERLVHLVGDHRGHFPH